MQVPAKLSVLPAALLLATVAAHAGEGASDARKFEWPMGRGNPGLTGCSPDPAVKPPFRLRWAYQTPASYFKGEPCVAAGKVFITLREGPIIALDADSGRFCWVRLDLLTRGANWGQEQLANAFNPLRPARVSVGFRSARCKFSTNPWTAHPTSSFSPGETTMAGMVSRPACTAARQRRSPKINS